MHQLAPRPFAQMARRDVRLYGNTLQGRRPALNAPAYYFWRRRRRSRFALNGAELRLSAEIRHWGRQMRAAGLVQVDKGVWYDPDTDVGYGVTSSAPASEVDELDARENALAERCGCFRSILCGNAGDAAAACLAAERCLDEHPER